MTLLETLIFTQIGSVGARDVPFHYETICTSQHKMARQNITVNKGLQRDAIFRLTHVVLEVGVAGRPRSRNYIFCRAIAPRTVRNGRSLKTGGTSIKIIS